MVAKGNSHLLFSVLAIVGIFLMGWYGHKMYTIRNGDAYTKITKLVRESATPYAFTNPLLFIDNGGVVFSDLNPLKERWDDLRKQAIQNGEAQKISIYFRNLNNTSWTGIEEDELFDLASLKKLILLIAYLRSAEDDPALASKEIYYHGDRDDDAFYKSNHFLKKGQIYPVRDLIVDMIVKSGNDSANSIFEDFDEHELAQVYIDLDLPFPEVGKVDLISPKIYSRLFRILYSSTYLQRDLSEQALLLLSQAEFDKGLTALLPSDLIVAHKFGERITVLPSGQNEFQLHDCGIVYYPDNPYFLCVMTKGTDFLKLEGVIAKISLLTYEYWGDRSK